jgi:hypothetical protein
MCIPFVLATNQTSQYEQTGSENQILAGLAGKSVSKEQPACSALSSAV